MNPATTSWPEIQAFLATAHALLPAVGELPPLTVKRSSSKGLRDSILQMLHGTTEEALLAIVRLHGDNTWSDISPNANTFLSAFFCCALNLPNNPTPSVESSELEALHISEEGLIPSVRRLYVAWWLEDGIRGWIRSLEADKAVFDSYFIFDPI